MDAVSLTATPASQANSQEASGLRVDGRDLCTQNIPAGYFSASSGWTRWNWTARHDAAELVSFDEAGNQGFLVVIWGDATNWVEVYASAANQIAMRWDDGGGPYGPVFWACGADVVAAASYLMEVRYVASWLRLFQDGVQRLSFNMPIVFTTVPTIIYWGSNQPGARQVDATYASP